MSVHSLDAARPGSSTLAETATRSAARSVHNPTAVSAPCSPGDPSAELRITRTRPCRGVTLYTVVGVVDLFTSLEFRKGLFCGLRTAEPTIVIDLSGVAFLGVVGLQVLQEAHVWAEPWHRYRLVTGTRDVDRLLRLGDLSESVEIFDLLDAALSTSTARHAV